MQVFELAASFTSGFVATALETILPMHCTEAVCLGAVICFTPGLAQTQVGISSMDAKYVESQLTIRSIGNCKLCGGEHHVGYVSMAIHEAKANYWLLSPLVYFPLCSSTGSHPNRPCMIVTHKIYTSVGVLHTGATQLVHSFVTTALLAFGLSLGI